MMAGAMEQTAAVEKADARTDAIRISVLIPSFNQARYLAQTLATVYKQDYPPAEVIVMDGGSTDETASVVKAYGKLVTTFVSERDRGQLDAMGKMFRIATGNVFYWLNADDAAMPGAFATAARVFREHPETDIVYSDDWAFGDDPTKIYVGDTISGLSFWDHFLFYRQMYSECVFWRAELTGSALPLDLTIRPTSDYSVFLPITYGRRKRWVRRRLGAFRMHAAQLSANTKHLVEEERERIRARMREKLGMSLEEFKQRQRRLRLSFWLRHRLSPKAKSVGRFLLRKLTADQQRKRMAHFFHTEWLAPPPEVAQQLAEIWAAQRSANRR